MAANRYRDKKALTFRDASQSFNELAERSNKVANSIKKLGINSGDRVCLYLPNTIQFAEAIFGIIKAGAVPVPLNLRQPLRILSYIVENSEAEIIIASSLETSLSNPEEAKKLAENTGIESLIMPGEEGGQVIDYSAWVEDSSSDFELPKRGYDDPTIQFYTSGTTGKPKGVPLSHKNCLTIIEIMASKVEARPTARAVLALPMYHIYGFLYVMVNLLHRGGRTILLSEPDPDLILSKIDEYKCTIFPGVPTLFNMAWLQYQENQEDYDLDSLELLTSSAGPLSESTWRNLRHEWKVRLAEGDGMTETISPWNPGYMSKSAGCVGWYPERGVEVKIVNPETRKTIVPWSEIAPWGEIAQEHIDAQGELAIRGSAIFDGYFKMPEKNKEAFDDEGWFYTEDIVRIDEDKALWIIERADNMIISGGENIYPAEVEEGLMEHPQIVEAAVVAAPHKVKGEVPVTFIVTKPDSDLSEEEIKEFSLQHVSSFAHPRRVFFKEELPKSASLNIQRFKLEEEVEERLAGPLPNSES